MTLKCLQDSRNCSYTQPLRTNSTYLKNPNSPSPQITKAPPHVGFCVQEGWTSQSCAFTLEDALTHLVGCDCLGNSASGCYWHRKDKIKSVSGQVPFENLVGYVGQGCHSSPTPS